MKRAFSVTVLACLIAGCASGSSSEITPAKSDASEKTTHVTGPSKRRMKMTVTFPDVPSVEPVAYEHLVGGGK